LNAVIWTNTALANLRFIRAYIGQFNPRAARDLANGLMTAGNSLETFPHRGRPVPKTSLRELVTAYPYVIRYRVIGDVVLILRIRHTSRRPTNP
jgi:toxin ParE1/3/4